MEPTSNQPADLAGESMTPIVPQLNTAQPSFGATAASSVPTAAVDMDLIEPEWVQAVKRIMEQHRNDPYALAQAMTALREDYLMKRYNRSIEQIQS